MRNWNFLKSYPLKLCVHVTVSTQPILHETEERRNSSKHLLYPGGKLLQDAQWLSEHAGSDRVQPASTAWSVPDLLQRRPTQRAPAALLRQAHDKWQILRPRFSVLSHLTHTSKWGSCAHYVSALKGKRDLSFGGFFFRLAHYDLDTLDYYIWLSGLVDIIVGWHYN